MDNIEKTKIRTRYAPSPTGKMHIGNLRSALYEYLIAKHEGGDFIIRIEDTDQERFVEGAVENIHRSLAAAGLESDEGPENGGAYGPYVQSERKKLGIYQEYAALLVSKGEAYYCFCDKERLLSLKDETGYGVYDKQCQKLTKDEVSKLLNERGIVNRNESKGFTVESAEVMDDDDSAKDAIYDEVLGKDIEIKFGLRPCIRQNNPRTGATVFFDEIYGEISVDNSELDDMVLIKSDGFPTYNFANVVDDHLMGITHVVRGNEYLSSMPKYIRLYHAFGWEVPLHIHLPLITGADHKKLSKRSGDVSFEDLLDKGYLAAAIVNYIALLGWSPEDNQEIFSLTELVNNFNYRRISKSPAIFDSEKLRWVNSEYIKQMDEDEFFQKVLPITKAQLGDGFDHPLIATALQTRIELWSDIEGLIDFLREVPPYESSLYHNQRMKTTPEGALAILTEALPIIAAVDEFENDNLFEILTAHATANGQKNGVVMWPIRVAISGLANTMMGATQILELLGKDESLKRIKAAIKLIAESID
ncbi:MAG: glutamate--tRNA ligase [Lachnospiraceae bacterium]|nr:glutamate--tRNA ligase [Lachnospiraceae bacterium]